MKVVLLSATNSRMSGGLFYSVKALGLSLLNHCKIDVSYVCHDDKYSIEDKNSFKNLPLAIYHISKLPLLKRWGYSTDIHKVLEAEKPDIIDIQGTWMYYSYAALKYRDRHPNTKIVITPRGTLDRINKHSISIQKQISCKLYENRNFTTADCFRALCKPEAESLRTFGIKVPIATIPNGFNLPSKVADVCKDRNKTLLYIGRINPKKGLVELIEALKLVNESHPNLIKDWSVRIAGWDQDRHLDLLKNLVMKYKLTNKITFIGTVYGKNKENELQNAQAFVLTSFSEGMPMSVLEAWAYGLPVVMTDGCNLPDGFDKKAAIRVTTDPIDIGQGLINLFGMTPNQRSLVGKNGYELVKSKYQWDKIAEDSVAMYRYLCDNTVKPSFVEL